MEFNMSSVADDCLSLLCLVFPLFAAVLELLLLVPGCLLLRFPMTVPLVGMLAFNPVPLPEKLTIIGVLYLTSEAVFCMMT